MLGVSSWRRAGCGSFPAPHGGRLAEHLGSGNLLIEPRLAECMGVGPITALTWARNTRHLWLRRYNYRRVGRVASLTTPSISSPMTSVRIFRDLGNNQTTVEIPRYQEFTTAALGLIHDGVRFRQIAGNELIVISAMSPDSWTNVMPNLQLLLAQPLLTGPDNKRNVLLYSVAELNIVLPMLEHQGLKIEHLYDY